MNNTYYGVYRTSTFQHLFPSAEQFKSEFKDSPFAGTAAKPTLTDANIDLVYYLLYSKYGNNPFSGNDRNRNKFRIFAIMFQYGPTWQARLDLQQRIAAMDVADLQKSGITINNVSLNDQTQRTAQSALVLDYISQQNTVQKQRSEAEALVLRDEILRSDVCAEFLNKFKEVFRTVYAYDYPLVYENELPEAQEEV